MSVVYLDLFQSYIALISEMIKRLPICLFIVCFIMQIINGVCLFSRVILLIFGCLWVSGCRIAIFSLDFPFYYFTVWKF